MTQLSPSDERSIRAILDHISDAWGRGDAGAFAAVFSEDSDYVTFDGSRLRGRTENEALHRALFASFLQDTRLDGEIESIRAITPDVVIVHSCGAVVMPWQRGASRDRLSRATYVLVKRAGQWQIAAFHNTRVKPMPPVRENSVGVRIFKLMARVRAALAGRGRAPS